MKLNKSHFGKDFHRSAENSNPKVAHEVGAVGLVDKQGLCQALRTRICCSYTNTGLKKKKDNEKKPLSNKARKI